MLPTLLSSSLEKSHAHLTSLDSCSPLYLNMNDFSVNCVLDEHPAISQVGHITRTTGIETRSVATQTNRSEATQTHCSVATQTLDGKSFIDVSQHNTTQSSSTGNLAFPLSPTNTVNACSDLDSLITAYRYDLTLHQLLLNSQIQHSFSDPYPHQLPLLISAHQPSIPAPIIPAPGSEERPSVGSAGHAVGLCKPCSFFRVKVCQNGAMCTFCHLCEAGEKKRRVKERKAIRKAN